MGESRGTQMDCGPTIQNRKSYDWNKGPRGARTSLSSIVCDFLRFKTKYFGSYHKLKNGFLSKFLASLHSSSDLTCSSRPNTHSLKTAKRGEKLQFLNVHISKTVKGAKLIFARSKVSVSILTAFLGESMSTLEFFQVGCFSRASPLIFYWEFLMEKWSLLGHFVAFRNINI